MADIILIKTDKTSLNLLEHYNVTNYTATTNTLQLGVHVARIAKDKIYIMCQFNTPINSQLLSGRSNMTGVLFFTAEMSTFLHIRSCV